MLRSQHNNRFRICYTEFTLIKNCSMWELLRKFNDIRTARKFANCQTPPIICRNYCIILKISKEL
ncbi:hypothetical protein A6J42_20960 [Leptospira interrogans serovar Copenhageni]|nr:hypothetical protein B2G47_13835 [Leptospira interrogans serovar Canicola]AVI60310.1 hypothetical protein A6J42_20960 [Leptospira interrogans serovar Copenhageni]KAA1269013.1 hypothetical protein C5473_14290 [Leptospira interrogans serovar Weerasinghe]KAA1291057.1 hypothetical protein C4X99_12320 [Leptospira interrogans serovar Geyaweera]